MGLCGLTRSSLPHPHCHLSLTMDSRIVLPAVLLVLCSLVDTGDFQSAPVPAGNGDISCYQCNSYEDALCGDPFSFEDGKKEVKSGDNYLKPCVVPEDKREEFAGKTLPCSAGSSTRMSVVTYESSVAVAGFTTRKAKLNWDQ